MAWGTSWDKPENSQAWKDKMNEAYNKKFPKIIEEAAPVTERAWNNLKPTHDPYTNPNAFLYYECECGNKLDPHVKSFAALNNAAMNADWKVRWGPNSYVPYCSKCVEEKGIE